MTGGGKNKFMAYYNGKKIISRTNMGDMTMDEFLDKRGTLNRLFYQVKMDDWSIVDQIDFTKFTDCNSMFYGSNIVNAEIDTSKIKYLPYMFYQCTNLTSAKIDISSVERLPSNYWGSGLAYVFGGCVELSDVSITGNVPAEKDTFYAGHMFANCNVLIEAPYFDTKRVDNTEYMFSSCYALKVIPAYDFSNVGSLLGAFNYCYSMEEFHATGMKVSFDLSSSTKFTESALVEVLNNLATVTSTKTLTLGATNLAKLTDAEKKIATDKGWTLA